MKGNDGTGNIEERDDWETPQELWNKLNKQYKFNVDCCATKENAKCNYFSSNLVSEFLYPINEKILYGMCWMNPPFSKAYEMFEQFFIVNHGIAIYRCDNLETKLWQDIILKNATWILIPKGRISYEGKAGKGSRFPSALIGYKVDVPKHIKGSILICKQTEMRRNESTRKI